MTDIMAMGCASRVPAWNQYGICCSVDAMNDAVANDADVINCSFGNGALTTSMSNALNNARSDDTLNASSNFGSAIDLAAPGTGIRSTITTNLAAANPNGTYVLPLRTIDSAIDKIRPGETIVLNGDASTVSEYHYSAQTISRPVRLTAFPDRPVIIGR